MTDRIKLKEWVKILWDFINFILPWVTKILALFGFIALIVQPSWRLYQEAVRDAVAFVVPICERYPLEANRENRTRYLGVNIYALNPVLNARVRFSGIDAVLRWGLYSDGLSDTEIQSFLSELPTGEPLALNEFMTPPLPALSAETSTTLMMIALTPADDDCRDRDPYWVNMTTSQGDVYHGINFWRFREAPVFFLEANWAIFAAYLVLFSAIVAFAIYRYTHRAGRGDNGT